MATSKELSTFRISTPYACIQVTGLPKEITPLDLYDNFKRWGWVTDIAVINDESDGHYALIQYKDVYNAMKVLEHSGGVLLNNSGHAVYPSAVPPNRTLFVTRLPLNLPNEEIEKIFSEFGKVLSLQIVPKEEKKSAFIKLGSRIQASVARKRLKESHPEWVIDWAFTYPSGNQRNADYSTLIVSGIPQLTTRETLLQKFCQYGSLWALDLFSPLTEAHHIFAIVRYADQYSGLVAFEAENGSQWQEKKLKIQFADTSHGYAYPVNNSAVQFWNGPIISPMLPISMPIQIAPAYGPSATNSNYFINFPYYS